MLKSSVVDTVKYCPALECSERSETGRPAEYRLHVSECASCGTPLLTGPAPSPEDGPPPEVDGRTVVVARCASHFHSQSVQHILKSEGIPHYLSGDHASSLYGAIINVRVIVPEKHASRAKSLLDAQGLALDGEGAAYDEAAGRIERNTRIRPLTLLILLVLGWAFIEVIRIMLRG